MAKGNLDKLARRVAGNPAELCVNVVSGAGSATNIAISGIERNDLLVSVLELQPPTAASGNAVKGDRTAEASITSSGNIQLSTTSTTGNQLLVIWYKVRP